MQKITLELNISEEISIDDLSAFKEIFQILIDKGALSGVKGGQAILHFDANGIFQGCELDYWPWRRRK